MDCLYCNYIDISETAVGVCRCGAGLCRQHLTEQLASRDELRTIGSVTRTIQRGPTERRLLCPACAATDGARTARALNVVD
ncbi:hypothetical protein [Conexibacter arvalis]|uniref:DUF2180 family protein n=1 Tax=Conexibacter arvalis TaxID=912552 RepID=A0A840IF09_9ACTN|nr:hypothetical protein [Conexibacter arvalis]MBB4662811.1 hypothetical protein [Conexibacter arvalis]